MLVYSLMNWSAVVVDTIQPHLEVCITLYFNGGM